MLTRPPLSNATSSKGWIVQKFGGTSVGKFASNIATHIVPSHLDQNRLVVVCSARSSDTKGQGTTNMLLRAAESALIRDSNDFLQIVAQVREDHLKAARELISNKDKLEILTKEIAADCERLSSFLTAAQIIGEISPKTKDVIVGAGEKLSCILISALMNDKAFFLEIPEHVIPIDYSLPKDGLDEAFYTYLSAKLAEEIDKCKGKIGRGYTDLCAALLAVGLDADELQIWKEVDGIFTADPRKVSTARLLRTITPEEAAELTFFGSEVLHPATMEHVIKARIPIRIKNVENPTGSGTIIFPDTVARKGAETPLHPPRLLQTDLLTDSHVFRRRKPTAVTIKDKIAVLNIHSNRKTLSHGFFAKIFHILDRWKLVVDLISTSEVHVSMALHAEIRESDLKYAIEELKLVGTVDVLRGMAILSLVGKQMKNMVGIAANMFQTLAQSNINIEMISQGASEINISCVIDEKDAIKALNVIHLQLLGSGDGDDGFAVAFSKLEKKPWLFR
ncbi:putative aspartokinase [Neolecta irregularis DAH-3]|uniref:Aspartokinase n=1 Tax=Neolecta irregularis (strain DAH-3) TaxID=1198029 RepID=A0A1U7LRY5_NEOID|nr:putative aspartokinase [Neolecta irregularis DAH-3]|eukprot:OLL25343.1 putative aspartokinase [Neolecta irregularis DAH-3]